MNRDDQIFVAGHAGMVGSALVRTLEDAGYVSVVTATRREADLRDAASVKRLFADLRPDYVFLAAAKVGASRPISGSCHWKDGRRMQDIDLSEQAAKLRFSSRESGRG